MWVHVIGIRPVGRLEGSTRWGTLGGRTSLPLETCFTFLPLLLNCYRTCLARQRWRWRRLLWPCYFRQRRWLKRRLYDQWGRVGWKVRRRPGRPRRVSSPSLGLRSVRTRCYGNSLLWWPLHVPRRSVPASAMDAGGNLIAAKPEQRHRHSGCFRDIKIDCKAHPGL